MQEPKSTRYALTWKPVKVKPLLSLGALPLVFLPTPLALECFVQLPRRPPPRRLGRPRDDTPLHHGVVVRQAMFAQGRADGVDVPDIHPEALVQRIAQERREMRQEHEIKRWLQRGQEDIICRAKVDQRRFAGATAAILGLVSQARASTIGRRHSK
jgi:hypothetical protein